MHRKGKFLGKEGCAPHLTKGSTLARRLEPNPDSSLRKIHDTKQNEGRWCVDAYFFDGAASVECLASSLQDILGHSGHLTYS